MQIITLYNHKGGVSKTTTTFNLARYLQKMGKRVLVVDADPQCNMTELLMCNIIAELDEEAETTGEIKVLREINKETQKIGDCNITQFSDSVIFSLPLSQDNYIKMIEILAEYQRKLLYHNIICRGAVAYGKHYKEDDFMFSQALIEAYQLESKDAIYPRIIISKNLLEYFRPTIQNPPYLVQEKDGFYFVDYLSAASKEFSLKCLEEFNRSVHTQSLIVKEKYYWLYKYWEFKFKDTLPFLAPQFI